jgi:hypothetical protein
MHHYILCGVTELWTKIAGLPILAKPWLSIGLALVVRGGVLVSAVVLDPRKLSAEWVSKRSSLAVK